MQREQYEGDARGATYVKLGTTAFVALTLLLSGCSKTPPEATAVAEQFIRAYFVDDTMAEAVKLSSGAAKAQLEGLSHQIEAAGAKEPVKEKPRVKVTQLETQPISADAIGYVYRIDSETPGIAPIRAKLRVSKEGNAWTVSEFVQSP